MHLNHWDGLLLNWTISLPRSSSPYSTVVIWYSNWPIF